MVRVELGYNMRVITWAGFLAKLLQFCVEKGASRKVELALDLKKQAAWAFLQLHRALATLDEACSIFISIARPVADGTKTRLYSKRLGELAEKVDEASEQFLSLLPRLRLVLQCYDPNLAVLIGQAAIAKGQFLVVTSLSDGFSKMKFSVHLPNTQAGKSGGISYSIPSQQLLSSDWTSIYSELAAASGSNDFSRFQENEEWPTDCLRRLLAESVTEGTVDPDDVKGIRVLLAFAESQVEVLRPALKALESFIAKNFAIEDLVYVQGRMES